MTVADLLEAMEKRWPGAAWKVADDAAGTDREATLLRLSCDKALRQLDWHAVMKSPSTVSLTIYWYRACQDSEAYLPEFTFGQI